MSACSVCVQTVRYGMCQHVVFVFRQYSTECQHAVCVYRQYSTVCVSMQCVCTNSTVWYVSACSVFLKALLIPSVNHQPQCLSTKFQSHLYCRVRVNNPAHHHMCCDISTQPLFTSHSAVNLLALWLAMASAATCDNKIFHN